MEGIAKKSSFGLGAMDEINFDGAGINSSGVVEVVDLLGTELDADGALVGSPTFIAGGMLRDGLVFGRVTTANPSSSSDSADTCPDFEASSSSLLSLTSN